jgi:hypothetical protein
MNNSIKNLIYSIVITLLLNVIIISVTYFGAGFKPSLQNIASSIFICSLVFFFVLQNYSIKLNNLLENIEEGCIYKHLADYYFANKKERGWVVITKEKLTFTSLNNKTSEILIKNILDIQPYNIIGIFPLGVRIKQNNRTDTFITTDRARLIKTLNAIIP